MLTGKFPQLIGTMLLSTFLLHRVRDLTHLFMLYPNIQKDEAFGSYYTVQGEGVSFCGSCFCYHFIVLYCVQRKSKSSMPRAILNTICEWLFQAWWAPSKNSSKMLHVMSATPTLFYCRPQPFTNPNSPASSIMSPLQPSPMPRGVISPRIVSHAYLLILHFSYYHI